MVSPPSSCNPVRHILFPHNSLILTIHFSVPVARAQDMATNGTGSIKISSDDPLIVLGVGTKFTTEFEPKMQIMLNKHFGHATVEVVEVIDDTTLRIKKEFNEKSHDGINAKEGGVSFKVRSL